MNDAELREKIAEIIKNGVGLNLRWTEPMGARPVKVSVSPNAAADAILALVLPAIQAARVEALREAHTVAYEWDDKAARDIAALIEKETAP